MFLYILWFTGTVLTLLYKYISYINYSKRIGDSRRKATFDWFFEPSLMNAVSWVATLSASWLLSAVYIDKLEVPYLFALIGTLPLHGSLALFLGIITETLAPFIVKWLVSKATNLISLDK